MLVRHRAPATFYVATDFVERGVPFPGDGPPDLLGRAGRAGGVRAGHHRLPHPHPRPARPGRRRRRPPRSSTARSSSSASASASTCEHFAYPKALLGSPAAEGEVRAAVPVGHHRRQPGQPGRRRPPPAAPHARSRSPTACGGSAARRPAGCASRTPPASCSTAAATPAPPPDAGQAGARRRRRRRSACSSPRIPMALIAVGRPASRWGRRCCSARCGPGRHGEPFTLVKFRTMRDGRRGRRRAAHPARAVPAGHQPRRAARAVERAARRHEPGRAPAAARGVPRPRTRRGRRAATRCGPGLTGLAQVEGRNLVGWDERFELDVRYVETRSLALDLRIIGRTIGGGAAPRGDQRRGRGHDGAVPGERAGMSVVIVGAAGHGREVLDVVEACGLAVRRLRRRRRRPTSSCSSAAASVLLGGIDAARRPRRRPCCSGIGDSARARRGSAARSGACAGRRRVVHPLASLGQRRRARRRARWSRPGARLTTHIAVGRHGYVGPNATVGHDAVLGDYVTVLPGRHGERRRHARATASSIGTGANIRQGVRVGEGAVVGAGAVVRRRRRRRAPPWSACPPARAAERVSRWRSTRRGGAATCSSSSSSSVLGDRDVQSPVISVRVERRDVDDGDERVRRRAAGPRRSPWSTSWSFSPGRRPV